MPEVALQTLDLVGRELNNTLGEARTALETFVEQPENVVLLQRCVTDLHQVQGVLRLLEIFGAALLAEEMEQVTHLPADARLAEEPGRNPRCAHARHGAAAELRRARAGRRPRSRAGAAAAAQRPARRARQPAAVRRHAAAAQPQVRPAGGARCARLPANPRSRWRSGRVACARAFSSASSAGSAASAPSRTSKFSKPSRTRSSRWPPGSPCSSSGGWSAPSSKRCAKAASRPAFPIKRLLGLADREILQLYTQGEGRYSQNPPVELLNNLLYYAARATSNGPKVTAVRASFRLNELLMVDDSVEQERENLSAPVGEADAHRRRGHPRGPRQGQRRARHLRAPRRPAGRARAAGGHAAQDRRHAGRAGPRRIAPAGHRRDQIASKPWPRARRLRITPRWCTSPRR